MKNTYKVAVSATGAILLLSACGQAIEVKEPVLSKVEIQAKNNAIQKLYSEVKQRGNVNVNYVSKPSDCGDNGYTDNN